ncbi:MAG: DUF3040 domain-containing protein [Bifidobacteriaceae bacterium]|nr:DUF3040 domain-containing protein [Bifidobacteriaceae bacterium]
MPLSEYEQRVLAEMEQQLSSDDPHLVTSLATPPVPRRGRIAAGILIALVGLAVLMIGMTVSKIWLSLVGFGVMFVGAYLALSSPKSARSAKPSRTKPGFTDRFEKRWLERQGE